MMEFCSRVSTRSLLTGYAYSYSFSFPFSLLFYTDFSHTTSIKSRIQTRKKLEHILNSSRTFINFYFPPCSGGQSKWVGWYLAYSQRYTQTYRSLHGLHQGTSGKPRQVQASSHHTPIRFTRVEVRNVQTNPLTINREIALNKPLIPNLAIIRLSPEADFDF
jgi:hypothetical protein